MVGVSLNKKEGIAEQIDDAGRLVVQREGGRTEALRCGEVTIRPTKTD